jgi:hypothetical protein
VGYPITWRNHDLKLKDGRSSEGKRILIDGQQRVMALMAALLGREVVNKDYRPVRIRIAFHPATKEFKVLDAAIAKDAAWLPDIAIVFDPCTSLLGVVDAHCARNPGIARDEKDDLCDPSYSDMLRVAFTSEFKRGRLEDLVALLPVRNFETKQYEEAIDH